MHVPSELFFKWFATWSCLWTILTIIPPGSKATLSLYRLHFCHGVISSAVAILCILGYVTEEFTTPCTLSYFAVDFVNILVNDFVFKVASYQSPSARKMEYFHHIFCFFVGATAEVAYQSQCSFNSNPFVRLMFAEFSTPFLMAWRYFNFNTVLGGLFVLSFIGCRIIYHAFIFIPSCMSNCTPIVGYGFGIPYNMMNFYFLYAIVTKLRKPQKVDGDLKSN